MPLLKLPKRLKTIDDAHKKWLQIVKQAQSLVLEDMDLQQKAAKKLRLKERRLPPEVLGRSYAMYCDLINKIYDAYLNSLHLQRTTYMEEIVKGLIKRMYELRNELVHLIVNDYIYVDQALCQTRMTPYDIQIVVPYHIPLESRPNSVEELLRKMWLDAYKRKNAPPPKVKPPKLQPLDSTDFFPTEDEESEPEPEEEVEPVPSEHTIIPEEFIQSIIIQTAERFRQFFIKDFKKKRNLMKTYFKSDVEEAPDEVKHTAAKYIQRVYREYMRLKRKHILDLRRDFLLGMIPDPFRDKLDFDEENRKIYERRYKIRMELKEAYLQDMENENMRLLYYKKDDQIDDITIQIREWFKEWFYGYGFFPDFPYDLEGGTIMVIREDFPTIEEKMIEDEKYIAATKGKTKDQLKQEKEREKEEAEMKAELEREARKKEKENLFKMRCVPQSDPGYQVQTSKYIDNIADMFKNYFASWSLYDSFPAETDADTIYGYIKPMLTEDIMAKLHVECREYVDTLMRLELKLLIKKHQQMYLRVGWKYPKMRPRKRPKPPPIPKVFNVDSTVLAKIEEVFDYNLITKPTNKIKDICGDLNYAAYEMNVADPDARFPPPGYGDIRRRLILSCVLGSGIESGAKRNRAVLLLGPERNGKSFLADCIAGEMNAVKIDITPEVFSAKITRPARLLTQVFNAAKVFQPAVIFLKNIERVFAKKVAPEAKYLKAGKMKRPLTKLVKGINPEDKIIFIATCSFPSRAKAGGMMSMFSELLLVPRTDYGTVSMFLYDKLSRIRSMPRDYGVNPLARIMEGLGFGVINELFDYIMTPERIVRLNVTPLSPSEFLEEIILRELEPLTLEDFQEYMNFALRYSPVRAERAEYEIINQTRANFYEKMAKQAEKEAGEKTSFIK